MKYASRTLKPRSGAEKTGAKARPRFAGPALRIDPDEVLARKIRDLALKPLGSSRPTAYKEPGVALPEEEEPKNPIQWPADQRILEVSKKLALIKKLGIRSEAQGDYFNSGDLAYQIQEIIRATLELYQKSQRIKH